MIWTILTDALRSSVLISGLVVVMMMLIESFNIDSKGGVFSGLRRSRVGQVVISAALGSVPGCMGGFASVSLYTHGIISFGALVAMMIATAGDESFVMLAMMPKQSLWIFLILFALAVVVGIIVDLIYHPSEKRSEVCAGEYSLHGDELSDSAADHTHAAQPSDSATDHTHAAQPSDSAAHTRGAQPSDSAAHTRGARHFGWKRLVMLIGVAGFITALLSGVLEEAEPEAAPSATVTASSGAEVSEFGVAASSGAEVSELSAAATSGAEVSSAGAGGINLLSEEWMYWLFGALSLIVVGVLIWGRDHFVEEHLWEHIVVRHLPSVFCWTFGVLLILGFALQFMDVSSWISSNVVLMILLAAAIGIIPESGPHLIFVTLFASGVVPLPVLLASCISQDGHAALPLLAESKRAFLRAKLINFLLALLVGLLVHLLF